MDKPARRVVAVVDNDYRVRESLESLLASSGLTVWLFRSAEEFMRDVEWFAADCLISDIDMPGLSGIELHRRVRKRRPEMPVLFITGRYALEDLAAELKGDTHLFFRKPFDAEKLLAAVQTALDGPASV